MLSITYSQYSQASIENLSKVNWKSARFPECMGHGNEGAQPGAFHGSHSGSSGPPLFVGTTLKAGSPWESMGSSLSFCGCQTDPFVFSCVVLGKGQPLVSVSLLGIRDNNNYLTGDSEESAV